jgi:translation initiation factor eIF-2B subunit alpha
VDNADLLRDRISHVAADFVRDGMLIMVHAYSRVVMALLGQAARTKRFRVLVTEAKPTLKGFKAAQELRELGIPAEVIYDAAIGHYMKGVNMVLVGAEGIVENGGLINQVPSHC